MAVTLKIPRSQPVVAGVKIYSSDAALGAGTVTSDAISDLGYYSQAEFTVSATISGTTTLNVYIQKLLASGDWDDLVSFTQISATGKKTINFAPVAFTTDHAPAIATLAAGSMQKGNLGHTIRVQAVVAGASPNAQVDVYASFFQ